ncbi:MAG TPA: hypothetical protein VFU22_18770, partial [Roseiflexaceae bacterium]|nr:hypothetical protein [Roseiflexaceae bacterium]
GLDGQPARAIEMSGQQLQRQSNRPMSANATPGHPATTMTRQRSFIRHGPVFVALLAIGGIYALVSEQFALGPRGLIPGLIVALMVLLLVAVRGGWRALGRTSGLAILLVVTVAEVIGTTALVLNLLTASERRSDMPRELALALLRDAALIWIVNILTFSLWYWEIDGGGPSRRHHQGYHKPDFGFPQAASESSVSVPWLPHYVDYLFLVFNTSTAFSPTDTLVLSVRAKLLMMTQALISLTVLAIIAARAINTL